VDECKPLAAGGGGERGGGAGQAGTQHEGHPPVRGRAVQVDPMKPMLKAPISKRLKLEHDKLLSNFAFKFDLRRYNEGIKEKERRLFEELDAAKVGRSRLTLLNPR
jgi:hypothetical protein